MVSEFADNSEVGGENFLVAWSASKCGDVLRSQGHGAAYAGDAEVEDAVFSTDVISEDCECLRVGQEGFEVFAIEAEDTADVCSGSVHVTLASTNGRVGGVESDDVINLFFELGVISFEFVVVVLPAWEVKSGQLLFEVLGIGRSFDGVVIEVGLRLVFVPENIELGVVSEYFVSPSDVAYKFCWGEGLVRVLSRVGEVARGDGASDAGAMGGGIADRRAIFGGVGRCGGATSGGGSRRERGGRRGSLAVSGCVYSFRASSAVVELLNRGGSGSSGRRGSCTGGGVIGGSRRFTGSTTVDENSGGSGTNVGGEVLLTVFSGDFGIGCDEGEFRADLCMAGGSGEAFVNELGSRVEMEASENIAKSVAVGDLGSDLESATDGVRSDVALACNVINQAFSFSVEEAIFVDSEDEKFFLEALDTFTILVVFLRGASVKNFCNVGVDVGGVARANLRDVNVSSTRNVVEIAFGDLMAVGVKTDVGARTTRNFSVGGAVCTLVLVVVPFSFDNISFTTEALDRSAISWLLGVEREVEFLKDLENFLLDVCMAGTDVVTGDVGAVGAVEVEVGGVLEGEVATFARTLDACFRVETFSETF